ncbi:MAG: Hsp20/alpha crystallin family protein [bacterium]|nr:Hsp20/alpha crystallin family protein [bacterium]
MNSLTRTNRVPSLFESFFQDVDRALTNGANGKSAATHSPAVEITGSEDAYKVRALLPGVAKEDLNVKVENGYLTISGKSSWSKAENEKDVYSEIHRYQEFQRSLRLDERSFAVEQVQAKLDNGVLEVTLPIAEAAKPKNISVQID